MECLDASKRVFLVVGAFSNTVCCRTTSLTVLVTAILAFPCLTAFADYEPDNPQRSQRVHPPGTNEELGDESTYNDEGEPAARDALNRVCPKGTAVKRVGELQLAPR